MACGVRPWQAQRLRQYGLMSLTEIQKEVAHLSPAERRRLREQLELMEFCADPTVMEELTLGSREAKEGRVHSREEVIAAVERAEREGR